MGDDSGNFWAWFLAFKWLGVFDKKEKDGGDGGKKPGCLKSIITFFAVIFIISVVLGLIEAVKSSPLIALSIVLIILAPIVIVLIVTRKKRRAKKIYAEAVDLFNEDKYTRALEKAEEAAPNNYDAKALAGLCYYSGYGCDVDKKKAFEYFKKSYEHNNDARFHYATMLLYGEECEQNIEEGKRLLVLSSINGNEEADLFILKFRITGEFGWKVDAEDAIKELRKMAEDGNQMAKYMLGACYYEGSNGLKQDIDRGLALIKEASEAGEELATKYLEELEKEEE